MLLTLKHYVTSKIKFHKSILKYSYAQHSEWCFKQSQFTSSLATALKWLFGCGRKTKEVFVCFSDTLDYPDWLSSMWMEGSLLLLLLLVLLPPFGHFIAPKYFSTRGLGSQEEMILKCVAFYWRLEQKSKRRLKTTNKVSG